MLCMSKGLLAASKVKYGLMCLKLAKLNLIVFPTFLTCFLNVKLESCIIPRYLNSDTTVILFLLTTMAGSGSVDLREKT